MEKTLYRKKNLDRISSPEELHDYMRVTSPRLWMLLSAIIILLAGFVVYASTATMENTMTISVNVEAIDITYEDGTEYHSKSVYAETSIADMGILKPGMRLRLAGEEGTISSFFTAGNTLGILFDMDNEHFSLPNGTYEAEIVLESVTPISFLLN